MKLRTTVRLARPAGEYVVIIQTEEARRSEGKYIVGRALADANQLAVVMDTAAAFHRELGISYGLRPLGGGWMVIDHDRKLVWLSSRSSQYGMEPDRQFTVAALKAALGGYQVERED